MKLTGNKILITGGATGIGLGLTERFITGGNTVIVCGRRMEALQAARAKFPPLIIKQCDVANEQERIALHQWIASEHADLNVLVNNAGIQNWMKINDADFFEKAKQEIAINVEAPLHLVKLFMQLPKLNTIMNVTSGLSFVPLTKVPVYSATKAFLHSFTWAMQGLLKENNIEVIEIIPPALNTDLGGKGLHDAAPPVSDFIASIFNQLQEGKTKLTFGFSEAMANASQADLQIAYQQMNIQASS